MSLRRRARRNYYQQLTEFELDRVVGLREWGFSFCDIAERLGRNVCIALDYWEQWSRNGTASRRPFSRLPLGTTEGEDRRIRRTAVAKCTASVAEI
ncbi:HTH_38 domain-containing protein [Trichonephila clavipes]|nr:HTH_38 domain-containing protein [Trichonephila clavipes]